MQSNGKQAGNFTLRGLGLSLLMIAAMALLAPQTHAQTTANTTIVNQINLLAPLTSTGLGTGSKGGWGTQSSPTGGSFVIDSHGNAIVGTIFANSLLAVNTSTGAVTVLLSGYNNVGATAIDSAGNLYVADTYSPNIYKLPYVNGAYVTFTSAPSTVCLGAAGTTTDQQPCQFAVNLQDTNGYYGISAMFVDSSNNFWIATNQWPGTATNGSTVNNNIMMCDTTCQTAAAYADAPVVAFDDHTNPLDELGEFAVDPWGNVFFTLATIDETGVATGGNPTTSGLYELSPVGPGSYTNDGPVLTYTNSQSYNNSLDGVAIDPNSGTVYFTTPQDGIFAVPNTESAGPNTAAMWTVSLVGGKGIALDANDNLYQIGYSTALYTGGADTLEQILVNNVITPVTGEEDTSNTALTVIDNGAAVCTGGTPSTLTFAYGGANASSFQATAGACASQGISGTSPATPLGVSFPVTLAFTAPSKVGASTATLTSTDSVTGATGTATLTGTTEKPQTISISTATTYTYSTGLTIAMAGTGGRSGNPVTFTLVSGPATFDSTVANQLDVSAPGTIVVDANQAGNATYAPAPTVVFTITVNQIAQSIAWAPAPPRNVTTANGPLTLTATGGASTNPVTFTLDAASTGFVSTTSAAAGTLSGNTLTLTGTAGVLVVDANQLGNTDYAAAPQVQATIVVTAALLPSGPPVILSQTTFLGSLNKSGSNGGATSNGNPNGGTMIIDKNGNGDIGITYGGAVLSFNLATNGGAPSILDADGGNPGAVAIDGNGNIFVGETYNANGGSSNPTCMGPCLLKIPYVNGAYTPLTSANFPPNTTTCAGPTTDQSACWLPSVAVPSGNYPIVSLAFDASGDLFYGIENNASGDSTSGITYPDTLWECDANCLYGGGDTPVEIFAEPAAGTTALSPTTSVQLTLGSLGVDPAGNLFFTDSAIDASGLVHYSNLNMLPINSGTSFPIPAATVLVTNIPAAPGQYVGTIDSIAIDPTTNLLYFSDQGATYAFLDNSTAGTALNAQDVNATMWTVSPQGAKALAVAPGGGSIYQANYESAKGTNLPNDAMFFTTVGSVTVPGTVLDGNTATVPGTAVIGTSTTPITQMYTALNDGNCTNPETVTFTDSDSDTVFTAALNAPVAPATSTCAGTFTGGSFFPTTLTFAPVSPDSGAVSETLTATDSSSNSGTATVSGTAQNLIPQTITGFAGITSPVTYGAGSTTGGGTYTLSATGGASGEPVVFTVDSSTSSVGSISGNVLTITGAGSLLIDINQAGNATYQAAPQVQVAITVNPAPQTIAFGGSLADTSSTSPLQVAFGSSAITISASDTNVSGPGSGEPITLSLDSNSTAGAGSLSGSTLTITGIGTIIVDATQAASTNGDYAAATQVQAYIQVGVASQTITATPSVTSATWSAGLTVTITASASSGLPVTLTQTSGSAIATLTGNTLTPTGTAFGPVTVQVTQAGNADYSAATAQNVTVTINPIGQVATPAFSQPAGDLYTNGEQGSYVTVTISDGTSGAAIFYTENDGPLTAYPTGGFQLTASDTPYTFTATASALGYTPSQQASISYTVSNLAPNFGASASPSAVNLTPGSSAIIDVTIEPNASFLGTVSFSCTGAPSGVTCGFSPATLTATGTGNLTTVVTISDAASTSANRRGPNPFIPGGATFALALCFLGFRKRRNLLLGLVLLAGIFGVSQLTGCGSGGGISSKGSTTSSMSVTATSTYNGTTITQTIPVTVTIRN